LQSPTLLQTKEAQLESVEFERD
ncbi:MAG: hypothetical protein RLZZ381_2700, partial [Cyanobacteriota bacterium]